MASVLGGTSADMTTGLGGVVAAMADATADDEETPCSGRGDCLNGTCLCEIRYSGAECSGFNLPYHAGESRSGEQAAAADGTARD